MLTKKDRQQLISDFKQVFATKDDLKGFATKDDLKNELDPLKKDVTIVKRDLSEIKSKVNEFYDFTLGAFSHLFSWSDEVSQTLKIKRAKRVKNIPDYPKPS